MNNIPAWHLTGDWFDLCSCSIPCPCEFAQAPTGNHCEGVLAWQIREGHYGDVGLAGLNLVAIGEFEGNAWAGAKVTLGMFLDDRADERQQEAIRAIFGGEAGGWPGEFAKLMGEMRGMQLVPITVDVRRDLSTFTVEIPGKISGRAEALTGPTALPGARVQLMNPPGSEVGPGQVATWAVALDTRVEVPEMGFKFEWTQRSSKHIPFDWSGPGE